MTVSHNCNGTCSKKLTFSLDNDNRIHDLEFSGGGCDCNLCAIAQLVENRDAREVYDLLCASPKCGRRNTSCPLELARAISELK